MANPLRYFNELRQWSAIVVADVIGAVVGPASSVAGHVATFADTTGLLLKDSGLSISWYDTRTSAAAATIPTAVVNFVHTAGRAAVGDYGAALYKKAGGSTTGGFQSADGQWWGLAETTVTPQMFGDCTIECHTAIQNGIDYLHGINGGTEYFPATTYTINATINLNNYVTLKGASSDSTLITSSADINLLNCAVSTGCVIEDLFFYNSNATPTTNVIEIGSAAIAGAMRHCTIWGGVAAINTFGTDWRFYDIYPVGNTYNIFSHGANFYTDCKIDWSAGTLPGTPTDGFFQSTPVVGGATQENQFLDCDFSGVYTNSITINDGGTATAVTKCIGCILSSKIVITNAKLSMFTTCEIGNAVSVGANVTLFTGNVSTTGVTISISGAGKILATNGNYQLT